MVENWIYFIGSTVIRIRVVRLTKLATRIRLNDLDPIVLCCALLDMSREAGC
jgi:hypothetical protein